MGQGIVDDDAYNALKNATAGIQASSNERNAAVAIIWVLHFPPAAVGDGWIFKLNLRKYNELVGLAKELGVHLVLSGHLHASDMYPLNTHGKIWGAGTATAMSWLKRNKDSGQRTLHTMTIDFDPNGRMSARRTNYAYNWGSGDFEPTAPTESEARASAWIAALG